MIRLLPHISATLWHSSATRASAWRSGEAVPAPRSLSLFFSLLRGGSFSRLHNHHRTTGFSLIEVMLAVVVLGLGILGLSAIFAGGARQQQISSNIIESVAIGLNAKASLKTKLGALVTPDLDNPPDGQWVWIRSVDATDVTTTALDISTIDRDNPNNGKAFFRVTAPNFLIYEAPVDVMGAPPTGAVGQGTYFDGGAIPPFGNGAVRDLPHGRVIPSALTIEVSVAQPSGGFDLEQVFKFTMPPPVPDDDEEPSNPLITLTLANDPTNTTNTITVNIGTRLPNGSTQNAFIQSFNLTSLVNGGTKWISKIEVIPYGWRSTELVSINERLTYVDDGRFPPAGRRPKLGYVLFFRRFGELNQAMIVIYSLQPQSRPRLNPDQFPFIPPDDLATLDVDALVREMTVDIGWDFIRKKYYVRVLNDQDNSWLVAPGQILLMKNLTDDPIGQGADGVVRVISQIVDPDESYLRGYLDDAPRRKLEAVTLQDETGLRTQIQVFALQREVVNADPADDTRWQVRPVDARLVPIAAQ